MKAKILKNNTKIETYAKYNVGNILIMNINS